MKKKTYQLDGLGEIIVSRQATPEQPGGVGPWVLKVEASAELRGPLDPAPLPHTRTIRCDTLEEAQRLAQAFEAFDPTATAAIEQKPGEGD